MLATERRPILLANGRILDPSRNLDIEGDLLIADGLIREAKRGIGAAGVPENTEIIDCSGNLIAPGLIDIRAFVGEPGAEYRETIASASQAAAAGGVTTIACQPDTSPVIDDPALVDFILRRALAYARDFDALIVHHTENPDLVGEGVMNEGEFAARLGLAGIPTAAETIMLERDMRLVALTGSRYHAASLTCAEALEVLRCAKEQGLKVTASASINHLTLNELDVGPYRTFLKLCPPLRAEQDRVALVSALACGLIDVVMSDHNPQDVEGKRLPFDEASPGAIGLETMLPAGLRLVHSGDIPLMTLIKAMSSTPAELLHLAGGNLRPGSPADVIVVDLDAPWVLDPAALKSKCKNTPFDEARLTGRVVRTIVAGRTVYEYV